MKEISKIDIDYNQSVLKKKRRNRYIALGAVVAFLGIGGIVTAKIVDSLKPQEFVIEVEPGANITAEDAVHGGGKYKEGEKIKLVATFQRGWRFIGWIYGSSNDQEIVSRSEEFEVTVSKETCGTWIAKYESADYEIEKSISGGSITIADHAIYRDDVVITDVKSKEGYRLSESFYELLDESGNAIEKHLLTDKEKNEDGNYTFKMPGGRIRVTFRFVKNFYLISTNLVNSEGKQINVDGVSFTIDTQNYEEQNNGKDESGNTIYKVGEYCDNILNIDYVVKNGWVFKEAYYLDNEGNKVEIDATGEKKFTMPAFDIEIFVVFESAGPFNITYIVRDAATSTVDDASLVVNTASFPTSARYEESFIVDPMVASGYEVVEIYYYSYRNGQWVKVLATDGVATLDRIGTLTITISVKPISYAITYDLDGGSLSSRKPTYTVRDTFTLATPTKRGYTFGGWVGTGLNEMTKDVTVPVGSVGERTYTAVWYENYTITYNLGGGAFTASVKTTYSALDDDYTLPIPTRQGYDFSGWLNSDNQTITQIKKGTEGALTLNATWSLSSFIVSADPNIENGAIAIIVPTGVYTSTYSFNVTGATGYKVSRVFYIEEGATAQVDATYNQSTGRYEFTMPANNVVVYAEFEKIDYSISVVNVDGVELNVVQSANYGDTVEVRFQLGNGYTNLVLTRRTEGSDEEIEITQLSNVYQFSMPNGNVVVTPSASKELYVQVNDESLGSVEQRGTYAVGNTITLIATANQGSKFLGWAIDGTDGAIVSALSTYSFDVDSITPHAYYAIFYTQTQTTSDEAFNYTVYQGANRAILTGLYDDLSSSTASSYAFEIPETITFEGESYSVVELGDNVFNVARLTSVDSTLGARPNLSVVFNSSLTKIGENCFYRTMLRGISLEHCTRLRFIAKGAFQSANQATMSGKSLPSSLMEIGASAFHANYAFRNADLSHLVNLREIAYGLFRECANMEKLILPKNIEVIGEYSIAQATGVDFSLCERPITIKANAFNKSNGKMTTLTLPAQIVAVEDGAFTNARLQTVFVYSSYVYEKANGSALTDCGGLLNEKEVNQMQNGEQTWVTFVVKDVYVLKSIVDADMSDGRYANTYLNTSGTYSREVYKDEQGVEFYHYILVETASQSEE